MLVKRVLASLLLVPLSLVVWGGFLVNALAQMVTWPFRGKRGSSPDGVAVKKLEKKASILILNWNGKALLEECLPSVVEAVAADGGDHEIIVIDNGSTDGSAAFLAERFPQVKVVCLDRNYSFIGGYNRGVATAKNDILVLLNNDMFVDKYFLRPLLDGFSDATVFAVSSQIFFWDPSRRREETGKTRAFWSHGMIQYSHDLPGEEDDALRYGPAFWLGGGSAAVDRAKFAALGGFDSLLQPLYAEDLDLSYMAWKRGWKVLFCPASKVIHKHRSTSGLMDRRALDRLIERNHLLFIWKNIMGPGMITGHLLSLPLLPWRRSWRLSLRDTLVVLTMAIARLPQALTRRDIVRRDARVSDQEIFQFANDALAYKQEFIPPRTVQDGERLNILFVTPYYPSLRHGGGVRMYQMIRALSRQHTITLLTFWDSEEDRDYFAKVESFCERVVMIERHPVTCRPLIPTFPPAITLDFGDPQFGAALRKLLIEGDFDVVQCEFLQTGYQVPRLRREVLVLTEHEVQNAAQLTRLGLERRLVNRIHNAFQWARWMLAEMVLARRFDSIVGVTEEDAWSVQRYDPRLPVEVIHTCVDVEYYEPQPPEREEADSLVYLGNFAHPPNVDSTLLMVNEILPRVKTEIPGVKFSIVGANPTPQIQALAKPGEIIVTGWVDDTRTYLANSRLAVFPIRLGVGIRTKILESMAMGKAVVTTPLGTAGLCPEHGKNIWVAEGVEEFAQGVITLLRDPQQAERIGAQAREFVVTQRSWESAAALQTKSYYRHLQQRDAGYAARRFQAYSTEPFHRPIGWRLGYLTTAAAYLVVPARGLPYILNGWRSLGKPNPFNKQ